MATSFVAGYTISSKTKLSRESRIIASESDSGVLRFVDLGAQNYWMIDVVIEGMTETERDTLTDWLETYETSEIALTVGANTYNGYIAPGQSIDTATMSDGAALWEVSFGFKGIKQ